MNRPVFVDAAYAASALHVSKDAALDLIRDRRIRTYGGHSDNPFVRIVDVDALVAELEIEPSDVPVKRVKSSTARVQTRLTADARWSDIADAEIYDWAERADVVRKRASKTTAAAALKKLTLLLSLLDEIE